MAEPPDDEARWAEAQALLDHAPAEPAHRQAARLRYDRRAVRFAGVVLGAAVGVALVLLAVDAPPEHGDPPTWRVVTGISVSVLGLVLLGARLARPYGSRLRLAGPLGPLPGRGVRRCSTTSGGDRPSRRSGQPWLGSRRSGCSSSARAWHRRQAWR
jgi:hypothetical protein